jgi:hypothetical protein
MQLIAFIVIFACVWISSLMFFDQVVYKVNPELDEKYGKYISITLGILFGLAAVLLGGDTNPLNDYN